MTWINADLYFRRLLGANETINLFFSDEQLRDDLNVLTRLYSEPKGIRNMTLINIGNSAISYALNSQGRRFLPSGVIDDRSEVYAKTLQIRNETATAGEIIIQLNNNQTELSVLKRLVGNDKNEQ